MPDTINYQNISYKQLKEIYLEKREQLESVLGRKLDEHVPWTKKGLIKKIARFHITLGMTEIHKVLNKN